jgi:hypothetical protein
MPRVRPVRIAAYLSNLLCQQQGAARQRLGGGEAWGAARAARGAAPCSAPTPATCPGGWRLAPLLCSRTAAAAAVTAALPRLDWRAAAAAAPAALRGVVGTAGARGPDGGGDREPPTPTQEQQQPSAHHQTWRARRVGCLARALGAGPAAAEGLAREHPLLLLLGPYALRRLAAAPSLESIFAGGPGPVFAAGHGAKAGGGGAAAQALFECVVDGPCTLQMRAMHWGERAGGLPAAGGAGCGVRARPGAGRRCSGWPLWGRGLQARAPVEPPAPRPPGMRLHIGQIAAHCHALGLSVDLGEDGRQQEGRRGSSGTGPRSWVAAGPCLALWGI